MRKFLQLHISFKILKERSGDGLYEEEICCLEACNIRPRNIYEYAEKDILYCYHSGDK